MERLAVLRPHLEEDVPLAQAARHAGVAVRTAERWLSAFIEGLGLKKPRTSAAAIHRRVRKRGQRAQVARAFLQHGLFDPR